MPAETVLEAAREGDWSRLLELLPNDPKSAEARDDWGRLPLHYAALQTPDSPLEVFRGLLEAYPGAGSTPIGWDEDEQLALDYAVDKHAPEDVLAVLKQAAAAGGDVQERLSHSVDATLGEGDEEEGWGDQSPSERDSLSGRTETLSRSSDRSPGAASASASPWLARSSVRDSSQRLSSASPGSGLGDELRAEMKVRSTVGTQADGGRECGCGWGGGGEAGGRREGRGSAVVGTRTRWHGRHRVTGYAHMAGP